VVWPAASVTVIVRDAVPDEVGVPERVPSDFKMSPSGKEPALTVKLYGAAPPVAVRI
jgi:hypothetical protein